MNPPTDIDLQSAVTTEFLALAELLDTLPDSGWDTPSHHVVIHGLDITVPLGVGRRSPDDTLRAVLDDLTRGGTHAHFGFDLGEVSLRATDMDWSFGTGTPISGTGEDLVLLVCGPKLPAGRIDSDLARRGTDN